MYLILDECVWYWMNVFDIGWMYLILEVLCVSRHFEAGLEIHNWSWQRLFVCPSSCQILCKGGGNLNMFRFTKPTISWSKYQNCCFGSLACSTFSVLHLLAILSRIFWNHSEECLNIFHQRFSCFKKSDHTSSLSLCCPLYPPVADESLEFCIMNIHPVPATTPPP